jgi:hypothetical protein
MLGLLTGVFSLCVVAFQCVVMCCILEQMTQLHLKVDIMHEAIKTKHCVVNIVVE